MILKIISSIYRIGVMLNLMVSIALFLTFSCGGGFLKDEPTLFGESAPIIVSSGEMQDYTVYFQGVGNAWFTISYAPAWLEIANKSGQFINDVTIINCKVKTNSDFSNVGIYNGHITLSVEGKGNVAIPVMYIVEGAPIIATPQNFPISYKNSHNLQLLVENTGEGILLWSVSEHPEWLLLNYGTSAIESHTVNITPPNGQSAISLSVNSSASFSDKPAGKIVIQSNAQNSPTVEIEVELNMGAPSLYIPKEYGIIDFGQTETTRQIWFTNQGNGILTWSMEGCPQWINVSQTNGILLSYDKVTLMFSCNPELMPHDLNTFTVYLVTNDISYPISININE